MIRQLLFKTAISNIDALGNDILRHQPGNAAANSATS
jgi:hypothetical protein